jgi:hypothetical protein
VKRRRLVAALSDTGSVLARAKTTWIKLVRKS